MRFAYQRHAEVLVFLEIAFIGPEFDVILRDRILRVHVCTCTAVTEMLHVTAVQKV